jgi:hypothetical protein
VPVRPGRACRSDHGHGVRRWVTAGRAERRLSR